MSFEPRDQDIVKILDGETPEGMQEVSDDKGVRVVTNGEMYYKTVEGQDLELLDSIYRDMRSSERTPETHAFADRSRGKMFVEQPDVPLDVVEAVGEYGLETVVEEVTCIWEEFIDNGYAPKELAPKDIRFEEDGTGILVDYIDLKGMGRLEETNMNPQVKTTFNTFADGTAQVLAEETSRGYEETYHRIAEHLEEASDYIGVTNRGKVNLCKTTYYRGPEGKKARPA